MKVASKLPAGRIGHKETSALDAEHLMNCLARHLLSKTLIERRRMLDKLRRGRGERFIADLKARIEDEFYKRKKR